MPRKPSNPTDSFVINVPREKYPLVTEALSAVLALAGLQIQSQAEKTPKGAGKASAARKPAKKTAAKTAGRPKTAKAKPAVSKSLKTPAARPASEPRPQTSKDSRLKELRTRLNLSQKALADKIGILQNHVSALETGRRPLTPELAKRLAKFFKVVPQSLMP